MSEGAAWSWRDPRLLVILLIVVWLMSPLFRHPAGRRSGGAPLPVAEGRTYDALDASHTNVAFATLAAIRYEGPVSRSRPVAVPPDIQRLNGQPISIDGFMLPIELDGDHVTRFILNANRDMCMFGAPSVAEQRIEATMDDGRWAPFSHLPFRAYGILEVRPEYDGGQLAGLYRMRVTAIGSAGLGY